MSSIDELIATQTALSQADRDRLSELISEWQLLADLSFADLILWVPKRRDYKSWPEGYIAIAHIRPTTAATVSPQMSSWPITSWAKIGRAHV